MTITVAILVTASQKDNVISAVNEATPEYTIGFARKICPMSSEATHETPQTHWYTNGENVPSSTVVVWQDVFPSLDGVTIFTAMNAENSLEWAVSNLASQGLQFVPDAPL